MQSKFVLYQKSATDSNSITISDANNKTHIKTYKKSVTSMALSGDGSVLIVGHEDGKMKTFATLDMKIENEATWNRECIKHVAASHNGDIMASTGKSVLIHNCYDLTSDIYNASAGCEITSLSITPDGRFMAFGDSGGSVWTCNKQNPTEVQLSGHKSAVTAIAESTCSKIVTGGKDGTIIAFERFTKTPFTCPVKNTASITAISAWPYCTKAVIAAENGMLFIWTLVGDCDECISIETKLVVRTMKVDTEKECIVMLCRDGFLHNFDIKTREVTYSTMMENSDISVISL